MILVDGVAYEGTVAPFDLSDRGFTLGDGLFETMAVFAGRPFRLDAHLDRLAAGLAVLGFSVPRDRLAADVATVAARAPAAGGVIRLTVTRGAGARGLAPPAEPKPTVVVSLAPFNPALVGEPTTLATVDVRRNAGSPVSRLKALPYLDNVLAAREAIGRGARDALILDTAGRVACASVANVFRLAGDRVETPTTDAVLPGITRALVLEIAPSLGLVPVERALTRDDLAGADAVFLTNSVRLLQPVTELDGIRFPRDERPAAILAALRAAVVAECGAGP
ncbi:aminotransferase class IV [Oharaeibacter diazotrophicus]|uniref:Probable branched-chain-amino-acid aminotransferase n=3 Tax=Oharaeibacter diazotrophicus TaxID=1920512 RepID=A0A4R6RLR7_9HYPH|nr:aminotransferase class IV [Oharaeibacter diazotrophicus]TDP86686.1 branched-chain amino acid aminotransferase [Oharaeibacter diazotrophicus]BBE71372.1 D-alanine aminotransferase [Pleomorphomonas sp. SM30]